MMILSFIFSIIPVLINVAFITLFERKILGLSQLRKGPNKIGVAGLPQPFNDAIKLFSKEVVTPSKSNFMMFFMGPGVAISLSLSAWITYPNCGALSQSLSMILIYLILSMNIYPLIISGWASNSNYAIIGSLRGIAQTISYEISFALILLFILVASSSMSLYVIMMSASYMMKTMLFTPIVGLWLISCVAETNRTPFDFAEGESELVSGFNVEYGSGGFALIFMAEYSSIFFLSTLTSLFFFFSTNTLFTPLLSAMFVFIWVWLRTTLPRYRYDMLMSLAWFSILPSSLFIILMATWEIYF